MSKRQSAPAGEHIAEIDFSAAVRAPYARYARHVLGYRHFAEGRDGLLPSQRRALWTLRQLGATSRGAATKTAKAAGYTCGSYHPHGDASMATTIANMTQFEMRHALVVGIGNFGWHDARPAAARYTSCHLSEYARTFLDASELTQVPMDASYDGKSTEPRFLPARMPHLLVGGCRSVGVGFAGYVPPCDARWVLDAVEHTARGSRPAAPTAFAYRWGGTLVRLDAAWLRSGAASAVFEPLVVVEPRRVLITSLAPGLPARTIVAAMTRSPDLASISEETPEAGELVRLVATVRRGGDAARLGTWAREHLRGISQSYSFLHIRQFSTPLGVDYEPVEEGPAQYLRRWVRWRTGIVAGAARHRASEHRREAAWLRLVLRAVDARGQLVAALDAARDKPDLARRAARILRCTAEESARVIDMQFHRFAFMNTDAVRASIAEHDRAARDEDATAASPSERMLANAHDAYAAMTRVQNVAAPRPKPRRGRKGS